MESLTSSPTLSLSSRYICSGSKGCQCCFCIIPQICPFSPSQGHCPSNTITWMTANLFTTCLGLHLTLTSTGWSAQVQPEFPVWNDAPLVPPSAPSNCWWKQWLSTLYALEPPMELCRYTSSNPDTDRLRMAYPVFTPTHLSEEGQEGTSTLSLLIGHWFRVSHTPTGKHISDSLSHWSCSLGGYCFQFMSSSGRHGKPQKTTVPEVKQEVYLGVSEQLPEIRGTHKESTVGGKWRKSV